MGLVLLICLYLFVMQQECLCQSQWQIERKCYWYYAEARWGCLSGQMAEAGDLPLLVFWGNAMTSALQSFLIVLIVVWDNQMEPGFRKSACLSIIYPHSITLAVGVGLFLTRISNYTNHLLRFFSFFSSHFLFNSDSWWRSDKSINQSCLLTEQREMTWEAFRSSLQNNISACTSDCSSWRMFCKLPEHKAGYRHVFLSSCSDCWKQVRCLAYLVLQRI